MWWLLVIWLLACNFKLAWVNPTQNNTGDSCNAPGSILQDLSHVEIWYSRTLGATQMILFTKDERHREGLRDSTYVSLTGLYWLICVDTTGVNKSCGSNKVYRGIPTGIDPVPIVKGKERVFNVRGQLVTPGKKAIGRYYKKGGK